jgi:hypothetical protein
MPNATEANTVHTDKAKANRYLFPHFCLLLGANEPYLLCDFIAGALIRMKAGCFVTGAMRQ